MKIHQHLYWGGLFVIGVVTMIALSSCAPAPHAWRGTPNPLDTPATVETEPSANGHFGPFGSAPLSHRNFTGSP